MSPNCIRDVEHHFRHVGRPACGRNGTICDLGPTSPGGCQKSDRNFQESHMPAHLSKSGRKKIAISVDYSRRRNGKKRCSRAPFLISHISATSAPTTVNLPRGIVIKAQTANNADRLSAVTITWGRFAYGFPWSADRGVLLDAMK